MGHSVRTQGDMGIGLWFVVVVKGLGYSCRSDAFGARVEVWGKGDER